MMGMGRGRRNTAPKEDVYVPDTPFNYRRLFGYLKPYRKHFIFALFALIGSSLLSLVFPAVIQQVIDSVLDANNIQLLDQITLSLIFVFLLRSVTSFISTYYMNYIGERVVLDLRLQVFEKLQQLSLGYFAKRRVGELVSRLASDVTAIRGILTNNINTLLQQSVIMVGSIIIMLVLNVRLTLFILALIPVIVILSVGFGILMRRTSTQIQDEIAGATIIVDEVLQNVREVKTFVREDYEIGRYRNAIYRAFDAAMKLLRLRSGFGSLIAFLGFASLALVLWFGGREVIDGHLTGGELIAFLIYGLTVAGSLGSMVSLYTSLQEAIGASKRTFEILDTTPEILDKPHAQTLDTAKGRVTFDHVGFAYEGDHTILHDIQLDIAPGEIIAFVGPSGAGKSTLFNLIPRFYDPTQGTVKIDDIDLRDVTQKSLRENIGIVPQETLLFGGTVRENIRYGKLEADDEAIFAAARAANAHDFITELPQGYDTVVGERGIRLSGGQRQRIAIARAVLKNPRILLLDEATSSLDSESEYEVQEALQKLMRDRTTIIIAHRLSTIRIAHRIVVVEKGHLLEVGSHEELMAKDGLYAKMVALQFRDDLFTGAGDAEQSINP